MFSVDKILSCIEYQDKPQTDYLNGNFNNNKEGGFTWKIIYVCKEENNKPRR